MTEGGHLNCWCIGKMATLIAAAQVSGGAGAGGGRSSCLPVPRMAPHAGVLVQMQLGDHALTRAIDAADVGHHGA